MKIGPLSGRPLNSNQPVENLKIVKLNEMFGTEVDWEICLDAYCEVFIFFFLKGYDNFKGKITNIACAYNYAIFSLQFLLMHLDSLKKWAV